MNRMPKMQGKKDRAANRKRVVDVEADKEEAARVKAKEIMTDEVLSTDHLSEDTWVRIKFGTYKGDLAKVMYVDNVRQKVGVKLIPRIDLQAMANKQQGKQVEKEKSRPQQRLMDIGEAFRMNIDPGIRRDPNYPTGYFDYIGGMLFRLGFLHTTVPIKSISTRSIQPSDDELKKFKEPRKLDDEEEEEETPISEAKYGSELSEKQLMTLFPKYPVFRFDLRSVVVKWNKNLGKQLKLSGFIQFEGASEGGTAASNFHQCDYDDTVAPAQGEVRTLYLDNCRCLISASSSVRIHVKLHVTALKVDDVDGNEVEDKVTTEKEEIVEKDDNYHNGLERDGGDDDLKLNADGKDDVEVERDDDDFDVAMLRLGELYTKIGPSYTLEEILDITKKRIEAKKYYIEYGNYNESAVDYNEAFEVCSEQINIDLSESTKDPFWCGVYRSYIIDGKYGSIELFYVALKYTVDVVLEVELDTSTSSKEIKAARVMMLADYGAGFNSGKEHHKRIFVKTKPEEYVKPGKIELMRDRFAVPANSSLQIYAQLRDFTSGKPLLSGNAKFFVPLKDDISIGCITDEATCSLKLKLKWIWPTLSASC